ncbi:protein SUPPRESSOR OF GENE SILENCING 3-like [Trifolium pratense]|uniref:protein SUPPRESSOR OF GENE SILENCING 3-like n=1 Tax=Trifolium pratense TaxID=57577 RepID=UPI001E697E92|nr:protein SUPPRESSOR OF GENE SILENCING 3-like [Trifolium pratense]
MADDSADPFPMLGSVYRVSGSKFNQLSCKVADTKLNAEQTGESKVIPIAWCSPKSSSNAWSHPNVIQNLTKRGNSGSGLVNNNNNLQEKSNSPNTLNGSENGVSNNSNLPPQSVKSPTPEKGLYSSDDEIFDSESDIVFDSDDDFSLDDTDSDTGEKSHEGRMKSKWFRSFFDILNKLKVEEINSQAIRLHCPACQGGTGAIDWYQGLQPLLNHSRTVKVRRVRLHRAFAETLEEECSRRGASLLMVGEAHGLWEGLDKKVKDHEIVWPPMVVIMNTKYEQDENENWTGMGNQELLDCFSDYAALKARHSYGPRGHRGMSVLIFEVSTAGYLEAVRLHKHFKEQGRDRQAWDHCKNPFVPGGKRQLYGYLATREDLDIFNKHSGGKSKLKFEIRSYQEMVESKIKHINDDGQKLDIFKEKIAKEQLKSKVFADTLCQVTERLRKTTVESRVVRERTKEYHQQNKEEMDAQETFFLDKMQIIHQAIAAKEDEFAKSQQAKREMLCAVGDSSVKEDDNHIMEKISSFIKSQDKDMRQFEAERDDILKINEEKKLALKKKYWQELVELEKELENELSELMNKYTLSQSQEENRQQ